MQLFATPDNPVPPEAIVSAARTPDGVTLRVARWSAGAAARGTVVILTGRAEFIEKYYEVIRELRARRFDVLVMDWRGQGLSDRELADPRKGHVADFAAYERDLAALVRQVVEPFCPKPWFALGHSMGGAVLAGYARGGACVFDRIVLTAPMIDIKLTRYSRAARLLAAGLDLVGLGGAFIPGGGVTSVMSKPFEDNVLTSDPQRFARTAAILKSAPQLSIGDPTIGWLNAAFRQMRRFKDIDFPRRTMVPILIVASGADTVVDTTEVERFGSRLKAGRVICVPGARHEIMMEREPLREQFWAAFDAFIPGELEATAGRHAEPAHAAAAPR